MTPHYRYRCHVTGQVYVIAWDESPTFPQDAFLGSV